MQHRHMFSSVNLRQQPAYRGAVSDTPSLDQALVSGCGVASGDAINDRLVQLSDGQKVTGLWVITPILK